MIEIKEPVRVTKAWNGPDVTNPAGHIVTIAKGACIRWLMVDGFRVTEAPAWLVVEDGGHLHLGPPPKPAKLVGVHLESLREEVDANLREWWAWTRNWLGSRPAATQAQYMAAFVNLQGQTVFYSQTFLVLVRQELNAKLGQEDTFEKFRDWIIANSDAEDIEGMI